MKIPMNRLANRAGRFLAEDDAALSIEAAIMLPILCAMYVSGYQFFDGYRREAQIYKANYAVADLVTRQTKSDTITPVDLEGLQRVFETLTSSENQSYMRFTEVRRNDEGIEVIWSYASDGQPGMTTARVQGFLDQIPSLSHNERVVLVESYTYDAPFFSVGLEERIIDVMIPISPRYHGCIPFTADPDPNAQPIGCQEKGPDNT